ncbi:MAG: hypothetical protein OEP48_02360 [Betaproteobacteria bacterium]|nr:hypothetical protein [Betaproteobacteria bacterium]MDH3435870.1 hypothetical protein [Betaproteobacteria bacterium]
MKARLVGLVGCCALLASCGMLQEVETQEPDLTVETQEPAFTGKVQRPISDVESLLLYYHHIGKLKEDQLSRELEISRRAYARKRSDFNRVRLAMLLGLPNTALSDNARALELLDSVAKNEGGEFSALAALLAAQVRDRQRLDATAQDLQQKLDALKSLERSMMERKR